MKPTPIAVAAGLFLSYELMKNLTPRQLLWAYVIVGSSWKVARSYRNYLSAVRSLGPGGPLPMTLWDWFAAMALTAFARVDVFKAPQVRTGEFAPRGCIPPLPRRKGVRPKVNPLIPTRQLSQKASPSMIAKTYLLLKSYEIHHSRYLRSKISLMDREDLDTLFCAGHRLAGTSYLCDDWRGEVAHVHRTDGSVHVVLHPEDVGIVITAGWGERHPLCANDKRRFTFLFHGIWERPLPVPEGLVLLYAPRTNYDLRVLKTIVTAAVWYASRGELPPVALGPESMPMENQADMEGGAEPTGQQGRTSSLECSEAPFLGGDGDSGVDRASDAGQYMALMGSQEIWARPGDASISEADMEAA
jgi:hypothetical protein